MSDPRAQQAIAFLHLAGWETATRIVVAGDASNRRYERLTASDGGTAILMNAPPDKGEDVGPFVHITELLRAQGLSAPRILAQDKQHGFLLLEDLGDDLFARVIAADPTLERALYTAAIDTLVALHAGPMPDLPAYDAKVMVPAAALAYDWYLRGVTGGETAVAKADFEAACHAALTPLDSQMTVLIQRDYHAENLLWLPQRDGVARVGLLDYQDAMLGHPAYDVVSILQDARRDVSPELAADMVRHFVLSTGTDADAFETAYALLAVQRNMRILGVFARLSMAYGKPHYVDLIPRVWRHIQTNLVHPATEGMANVIASSLPEPTPENLQKLKDQCATPALP